MAILFGLCHVLGSGTKTWAPRIGAGSCRALFRSNSTAFQLSVWMAERILTPKAEIPETLFTNMNRYHGVHELGYHGFPAYELQQLQTRFQAGLGVRMKQNPNTDIGRNQEKHGNGHSTDIQLIFEEAVFSPFLCFPSCFGGGPGPEDVQI